MAATRVCAQVRSDVPLLGKRKAADAVAVESNPIRRKLSKEYSVDKIKMLATQAYSYGEFKSGEIWLKLLYKKTGDLSETMNFKKTLQEEFVEDLISSAKTLHSAMQYSWRADKVKEE